MSKAMNYQLPIENEARISELMEIVNGYYPESSTDYDYIETCFEEAQDFDDLYYRQSLFRKIGGVV